MKLEWEVDGVDVVVEKLEDGIEAGMERAVENILEILEREAKDTIRVNRRVFTKEVINSFTDQTGEARISDGLESRFLNTARHAGAVEHGVHRSKYADGGPPIAALMPWVLVNLQDWNINISDDGTGGNTLKQSTEEEAFQNVSEEIDLFNTKNNGKSYLKREERKNVESSLKASSLDDTSTDEMLNQIESWKESNDPYKSWADSDRIIQYETDLKRTFDLTGDVYGSGDVSEPEPTYDETKAALRTLHEISKTFAYNHLDDGDGEFIAYRYNGVYEISHLGKEMWENPSDSEWEIDTNPMGNYTTEAKRVSMFDKGVLHNRLVDIEDDLLVVVDQMLDTKNNGEAEIHVRGGNDFLYHGDNLDLTATGGRIPANDIFTADFENTAFSDLSDDKILALSSLIRHMGEEGISVETQAARDRVNNWFDVFMDRGIYESTGTRDYKWEQYVDTITS
jgi:hypothetical protein